MDTTDSKITFDENGVCDYCRNFDKNIKPFWKPQENRFDELEEIAAKIRKAGEGQDYDCILGLSGGADSSYLAYIAVEVMHLRPLVFVVASARSASSTLSTPSARRFILTWSPTW